MTTLEAAYSHDRLRVYLNGHRLRALWAVVAVGWAVVIWDWRRGW